MDIKKLTTGVGVHYCMYIMHLVTRIHPFYYIRQLMQ